MTTSPAPAPVADTKPVDNTITLSLNRAELEELCDRCMNVTMSAIVRHLVRVALREVRERPLLEGEDFRALLRGSEPRRKSADR